MLKHVLKETVDPKVLETRLLALVTYWEKQFIANGGLESIQGRFCSAFITDLEVFISMQLCDLKNV